MHVQRPLAPALVSLALVFAAVPAVRADFSNASLSGSFAGQFTYPASRNEFTSSPATFQLQFDGSGHVTGARTIATSDYYGGLALANQYLTQALEGSYSIQANGMGQMTLTATPEWHRRQAAYTTGPSPNDQDLLVGPTETWQVVITRGGASFSFTVSTTYTELNAHPVPATWYGIGWTGEAVSQDSPCGEAAAEVSAPRTRRP